MVLITGLNNLSSPNDAKAALHDARSDGYDFVTTNLPHCSSICREDITSLESRYWGTSVVGVVTSPENFIPMVQTNGDVSRENRGEELIDALNGTSRLKQQAEDALSYMAEWAGHMNIPAVILPRIPSTNYMNYGRFLASQALKSSANGVQLWVRMPFEKEYIDAFRMVHKMCDGAANLGCILEFKSFRNSSDSLLEPMSLIHELIGCNLRAVSFHTTTFLINKKGFPTLSKACQFLLIEILKRIGRTCRVLVEGVSDLQLNGDAEGMSGCLPHLQYLRFIRSKEEVVSVLDSEEGKMEMGYLDHLQSALQPLGDNLEFSTYEVFEKDPVKYNRYREAVELALEDKIKSGELRSQAEDGNPNHTIMKVTIFVVGAGRGPLVNASLDAVENINRRNANIVGNVTKVSIFPTLVAIEKNQCAVLYLQSLKAHDSRWKHVTIVECDMRVAYDNPFLSSIINGPDADKVDIVVSELLGSFGCNELSPECLDGFQRSGLMKETCVSIPQSYTSYIAPVTSMKLHSEAQAHAFFPSEPLRGPGGEATGMMQAMETPYVVRSHLASQTHEEQSCWEFSHPTKKSNVSIKDAVLGINRERSAEIIFSSDKCGIAYGSGYGEKNTTLASLAVSIPDRSSDGTTIHGLLGTFSCVLYKSASGSLATISIQPTSFSVGMFSWFPLFFPLRDPLFVPHEGRIQCGIWRKVEESNGAGRVWYEWCVSILSKTNEILAISPVHNPNGRSCVVRL